MKLSEFCNGYVDEVFQTELNEVLMNIMDPNTDPEKKREITIKISLTPNKERNRATTTISISSKTCPVAATETILFFGVQNGVVCAQEHYANQLELPGIKTPTPGDAYETGK